jgi:competence protein ComEC
MWQKIFFLKATLALSAGIITSKYIEFASLHVLLIFTAGISVLYISIYFLDQKLKSHYIGKSMWLSIVGFSYLFLIGYISYQINQSKDINHGQEKLTIHGTVEEILKKTQQKSTYKINLSGIYSNGQWHEVNESILLYLSHEKSNSELAVGENIYYNSYLNKINNKLNWKSFDAIAYYSNQGIVYYTQSRAIEIQKNGFNRYYYLKHLASKSSEILQNKIDQFIDEKAEQAVAKALLLGVRSDMDQEAKRAYSNVGVIHILAVSGLHVSILFFLLSLVLRPLIVHRWGEAFYVLSSIFVLWMFAFITGLSPSVVRAVVMFNLFLFAKLIYRNNYQSNTVFFTAFIMLLYNPFYLFDIGFQLSFLAVLGIVWVHPWLFACFKPSHLYLEKIWEAASVTLSAQLLTAPICIIYFEKFPSYFLPANLVLVLLSNVAMVIIISMLISSWLPIVPNVLGKISEWLLWLSNKIVLVFDRLPFASINIYELNITQALALYLVLIAMMLMIKQKNFRYSYVVLLSSILFACSRTYQLWQQKQHFKAILYHGYSNSVGCIYSNTVYLIHKPQLHTTIESRLSQYHFSVKYLSNNLVKAPVLYRLYDRSLVQFNNSKEVQHWLKTTQKEYPDYLIIDEPAEINRLYFLKNYPQNIKTNVSKKLNLRYYNMQAESLLDLP